MKNECLAAARDRSKSMRSFLVCLWKALIMESGGTCVLWSRVRDDVEPGVLMRATMYVVV